MTNQLSLGEVTDNLEEQDYLINTSAIQDELFFEKDDSPWYMQGLAGFGGWIAALFLLLSIGFCFGVTLNINDERVAGVFFCILAFMFLGGTTMWNASQLEKTGNFLSQLRLAIHITGHFLALIGIALIFDLWQSDNHIVMLLLFASAFEIVFIKLYDSNIYRFLATLVIVFCLSSISYIYEAPILISILTGGLMIVTIGLWTDKLPTVYQIRYFEILEPVKYGIVIGIFSILIYEVTNRYGFIQENTANFTTAILFFCLIWLETILLDDYEISLTSRFALTLFAISLAISIPIWTTPGILAGIIGILLAFRRNNRILQGISSFYLAGFIVHFYYWLDVTLLTKSIILMSTGVLMIIASFVLNRFATVSNDSQGVLS